MSYPHDNSIGIFDSGIGGLTVASEIHRELPGENIIYLGDTARVPYGVKSTETVKRYALEAALFLLNQDVKLIVAACNTVSAIALDYLQSILRIPINGVVKAGVKAAAANASSCVAVLGTPSTIRSDAYRRELHLLNPDLKVHNKACPLLVPLAEEGRLEDDITQAVLRDYLRGILPLSPEAVILGCTHYPLFKPALSKIVGESVALIDSAETTAEAVKTILLREGLIRTHGSGNFRCFLTDRSPGFDEASQRFFGRKIHDVELISLSESG